MNTTILVIILLGILVTIFAIKFANILLNLLFSMLKFWVRIMLLLLITIIIIVRFSSDTGLQKIELFSKNKTEKIIQPMNLHNVQCVKGSTYLFSFGKKIKTSTVNIMNENNIKNVTMTLRYYPSGNIQTVIFQEGKVIKVKGRSNYHDTGFYLVLTNDCTISASLNNL